MSNLLKGIPGEPALQGNLEVTDTDETTPLWSVNKTTGAMTSAVGAGVKNGSTVAVSEGGDGITHQTTLTLTATLVPIISVTTGNGVGGIKIYDFPEGHIRVLGCVASLSLAVGSAKEADYTDNTPQGDIGIGSVAPANADALGTDATDDDMGTASAFTMTAFVAATTNAPEAALNFDGSSTATDVYVNALVDAADVDDDTTTEMEATGTVTLTWINLGDV